jgi:hypothetical protein
MLRASNKNGEAQLLRASWNHGGYSLALQKCTIFQSVDYIHHQPLGMVQKAWTNAVLTMQHSYGAPISESDINSIETYLSVYTVLKMGSYGYATDDECK